MSFIMSHWALRTLSVLFECFEYVFRNNIGRLEMLYVYVYTQMVKSVRTFVLIVYQLLDSQGNV